ncbi:alpha/beta-hydrolase [Vararia minispora EC-137]|uniref:Alpha/beta-hydrolase n=1 Tax=Vararia minispora EC-137 TaxID=1314806 RepID=A0ACB8QJ44_9AGAM|nr:alpha/beta-hydrolase [Vararia minispora EC-137]
MHILAVFSLLLLACYSQEAAITPTDLLFTPQHSYELDGFNRVVLQSPIRPITPTLTVKAVSTVVYRPRSRNALKRARLRSIRDAQCEHIEWDSIELLGPDVEDQHTLGQLARMAANAYSVSPGHKKKNWHKVDPQWNISFPYGWEDINDGFRGHVFFSPDNSTIVLSIKGTTLNGPTSHKDKFNDNLLFSCCCARVDFSWVFHQVCNCYAHSWRCDSTCLSEALIEESLFYTVGIDLIANLTELYPDANIWLVGHSLGGALASLLGTTFGLPAVAFESPGERLAAGRLHLPLPPPSNSTGLPMAPVTHVYHTADPIAQGTCTGVGSPCVAAGYALETRCHLGKTILYDTVGRLGWHVDVRTHRIADIITRVLDVEEEWEYGRKVPIAREEIDCTDCFKWEFGNFKDKSN